MKKLLFLFGISIFFVGCQQDETFDNVSNDEPTKIETRAVSMRRSPTQAEKDALKKEFPNLNVNNITVTGDATSTYNCIAYSMGITYKWINPADYISDFQNQYINARSLYGASTNYEITGSQSYSATVDGWGNNSISMTHGSVVYSGNTWESKLGGYLRITHGRTELSGTQYGSILTSFVEARFKDLSNLETAAEQVAQNDIQLSIQERDAVIKATEKVNSSTVNEFNGLFEKWTNEIKTNSLTKYSSDTRTFAKLPQFAQMKAMGKAIIPLIMAKLLDENNFFALVLYDAIQENIQMKIVYKTGDKSCLEGEQNRAKRTILIWLKNE